MADKTAAELKRDRELEARKALFTQGNSRPANSDLSTLLGTDAGTGEAAAPESPQEAAVETPAAALVTAKPAVESSPPEPVSEAASASAARSEAPASVAKVTKPAKAPKPAPAKPEPEDGPLPWATSDVMPKGFTTKFPADLHAKMNWIIDNVPRQSIQKIVQAATREYVERIIAEVYKP
ncbi:hypothetical protein PQR05_29610 [Paraburkholderia sediminicola]|uniref:hypothetical protein n=1 Tax=Paraburkholderia sediminicola TaxID=458836 RepID=UPI0038B7B26B